MAEATERLSSRNESGIILLIDESAKKVMQIAGIEVAVLKAANAPHPDSMKVHPATVDKNLCVHCLACIKLCPSISWDSGTAQVVVNEVSCKGCGICGSVCPAGAISQRQFSNGMVFDALDGLWSDEGDGHGIESCASCPVQAAGMAVLQVPDVHGTGVRVICSGRIEPIHVLESAQMGVKGLLLIDCFHDVKEKDRFERAQKRMESGAGLLHTLGSPIIKVKAANLNRDSVHEIPATVRGFAVHHARSHGGGTA